jgi:predicted dehydrogenase
MTVRLGVLAASRIADAAVVAPAALVDGVDLAAVAARDVDRARAAADRWGVALAYGSYRELIDSTDVDAIYIGTPASLHRAWAIAAIEAGKHVLCEKPFAANADDAQRIADAARGAGVVVMEAFHWRYHPYVQQMRDVLDSGALGALVRVDAAFDIPTGEIPRDDIRWKLAIGGGSTMDLGCYPIQWVRWAVGADPEVVSAVADCPVTGVDATLTAELRWRDGVTGSITSSMESGGTEVAAWLRVVGEHGTMLANNPLAPQLGGATITIDTVDTVDTGDTGDGAQAIEADRSTTYFHQLVAFREAIEHGAPFPTTADEGVRTMAIIDACYRAAGLEPRPSID